MEPRTASDSWKELLKLNRAFRSYIKVKRFMPCVHAPFISSESVHVQHFAVLKMSLRRF